MSKATWGIIALVLGQSVSAGAATHGVKNVFLTKDRQAAVADFALPTAPARKKLNYYGGPVLSSTKGYAVMWGANVNADVQSRIGGMLAATLNSDYMDMLAQYSTNIPSMLGQPGTNQTIGRGSFGGTFTIQPGNASVNLQDQEIGAELERQIDSGAVPYQGPDSLYFLYFPPGYTLEVAGAKSCEVFCGYHSSVKTQKYGQVYYAVQPDLGGACAMGCGFADNMFDNMTVITAHELAEAVTDPAVDPMGDLGPPIAWVTAQGSEIGDLCASELTTLTTPQGTTYRLQQAFDNSQGRCNRGPFQSR